MKLAKRKKKGREDGRKGGGKKKGRISDTYLFARHEPKIRNFISHTRKENMNNYMFLSVRKIKPTSSLEEQPLPDTKNKVMFFTWI